MQKYYFSQYATYLFHYSIGMKKTEKRETDEYGFGLNQ